MKKIIRNPAKKLVLVKSNCAKSLSFALRLMSTVKPRLPVKTASQK